MDSTKPSRRSFLKVLGLGAGASALGGASINSAYAVGANASSSTSGELDADSKKPIESGGDVLNLLARPHGSSKIGHLAQPLSEKLKESVSIRDYGGGEEVADNYPAWEAAKAAVVAGGEIRLPKLSHGDYNFLSNQADFRGVVVAPDKGVRVLTASGIGQFSSEIVVKEDLTVRIDKQKPGSISKDYDLVIRKNFSRGSKSGRKEIWLSDTQLKDSTPIAVIANSQLLFKQILLGISDTFTSFSPTEIVTADALSLLPPAGGNTQLGVYPLRPGQEITAGLSVIPAVAGEIAVGVIWSTGYAVLRGSPSAGVWKLSTKYAGVNTVETEISRPDGNGNTLGYYPAQNHFTIRFISYDLAQILISGIVAIEIKLTSGYLMHAGFGGTSVTAPTFLSWEGWYRARFSASTGSRVVWLGACGDSLTDDLHGAWMWYAARALDGSLGIRVAGIENRAVSGDTTTNQYHKLGNKPFVNATHVVLFIGTNDIQLDTSIVRFKAVYSALILRAQEGGRKVSLVIPPLWYTKDQSGGGGGADRSQYGGAIRAAIGRFAADYDAQLIDLSQASGVISASFLENPFTDPVLRDNLHETPYFNEIIGEAIARGIAPQITRLPEKYHPWVSLDGSVYAENLISNPDNPLQYRLHECGDIEFRGSANFLTGAAVDGISVFTLPEHLRTLASRSFVVFGSSSSGFFTGVCIVQADALVRVFNVTGSTTINFDGVRYTP